MSARPKRDEYLLLRDYHRRGETELHTITATEAAAWISSGKDGYVSALGHALFELDDVTNDRVELMLETLLTEEHLTPSQAHQMLHEIKSIIVASARDSLNKCLREFI